MHNQALSFIGFCIIFENVGFILHAWGRRIVGMLIPCMVLVIFTTFLLQWIKHRKLAQHHEKRPCECFRNEVTGRHFTLHPTMCSLTAMPSCDLYI